MNKIENYKPSDDVLTLLEMSQYLKVSKKTIFRMLQNGKLSGFKVGNQWRFLKPAVDDWLTNKMQVLPKKNLINVISTAKKIIPLTKLISKRIILDIKPGKKREVLEQLIEPLSNKKIIDDKEGFLDKLLIREKMISTAIGHGVAFPHLRNPLENQTQSNCIVLGVCKKGTNFKALDGEKTYLFALIFTASELIHLRLLAKISLLFRDKTIVKQIINSNTVSEVVKLLKIADIQIKLNQENEK